MTDNELSMHHVEVVKETEDCCGCVVSVCFASRQSSISVNLLPVAVSTTVCLQCGEFVDKIFPPHVCLHMCVLGFWNVQPGA